MDSGDALLANGDGAIGRPSSSAHGGARTRSYMSRSRLKCVGKRMSNKPGRTKSVEHATADPRTRACTTGAFTPGIPSRRELKPEREQSVSGEVGTQLAQEAHHPCGGVHRSEEVRGEGKVVVLMVTKSNRNRLAGPATNQFRLLFVTTSISRARRAN